MNTHRNCRLAAGLAALGAILVTSACGSGSDATDAGATATYARALHDALPASVRSAGVLRVATETLVCLGDGLRPRLHDDRRAADVHASLEKRVAEHTGKPCASGAS